MQSRMNHPAFVVPGAMDALQALGKAVSDAGSHLPLELVHLRASQINGCSVCCFLHTRALRKEGETDDRLATVAAWREAPWFTPAEQAALALTEALTRLADTPDAVDDDIWADAQDHFDETELATLLLAISSIQVWNRLNAATHQVAGEWAG